MLRRPLLLHANLDPLIEEFRLLAFRINMKNVERRCPGGQ